MAADREELAARIERVLPHDGGRELQPGVFLRRHTSPPEDFHILAEPAFCVIARGRKEIVLGDERYSYDPAHYLITTVQLPLVANVVELPYVAFRLVLEPVLVGSVIVEAGVAPARPVKALDVSPLDFALLDAVLRLVRLLESPEQYRALGPLVTREIIYRLVTGAQAFRLHQLARFAGRALPVVQAIEHLRAHFATTLRVDDLARRLGMSVSGFHAHFKAVTGLSPLQFQKQLRLQTARELMLAEPVDAAEAGYRVGYDDPSHFSREYKRHFGVSPVRDIERLRARA